MDVENNGNEMCVLTSPEDFFIYIYIGGLVVVSFKPVQSNLLVYCTADRRTPPLLFENFIYIYLKVNGT